MSQTICRVICDGKTIEEVENFTYSSDVMAIAEEATFTVVSKNKLYRDSLRLGQSVEFILQNDEVNGGAPTVKHRGIIVRRNAKYSPTGGVEIAITSADLGWHLQNSDCPLWLRLQGKTYADICDPAVSPFFDPSWGFKGVRFEGDIRRRLKMGVAAVAAAAQRVIDPVHVIQCEAGEKPADKITEYSRRINLLLNVSPDGYVCLFRPNDTQEPIYSLRCRDGDPLNNVLDAELQEDARSLWTEVTVVGDQVGYEGPNDPNNPNATKKRGKVIHPGALPFVHRRSSADGEMFLNGLAQKQAEWLYKRGIFDAFYVNYTVLEHHQNGYWWEADNMASLDDDELGLSGNFYVQSVRCSGSKSGGDTTQITIRKPGLLSASFGEIPNPPIYFASGVTGAPSAAP
jgi:hypothetical protein